MNQLMITDKALITTNSESETYRVGEIMGKLIETPLVITLNGELGAGKTVLVKGAAVGLGVKEHVRSPSFTLMMVYEGRLPLYHFDFYRLTEESELETLGLDDYLEGQGVAFIEWGSKFRDFLPPHRLDIEIEYDRDNNGADKRILTFYPKGAVCSELTDKFFDFIEHNFKGEMSSLKNR